MLTVLARLTLWETISRDFHCVTFVIRMRCVVICDCASWKMKYDVFSRLLKMFTTPAWEWPVILCKPCSATDTALSLPVFPSSVDYWHVCISGKVGDFVVYLNDYQLRKWDSVA